MAVNRELIYEEVARVPDRIHGGELRRMVGRSSTELPDWTWWSVVGDRGAVTFIDMPGDGPLGPRGDFGVHYRDPEGEDCPLLGEPCRYAPNGPIGLGIAEQVAAAQSGPDDELPKIGVIWALLTTGYQAIFADEAGDE
jgi:hypothetical protein